MRAATGGCPYHPGRLPYPPQHSALGTVLAAMVWGGACHRRPRPKLPSNGRARQPRRPVSRGAPAGPRHGATLPDGARERKWRRAGWGTASPPRRTPPGSRRGSRPGPPMGVGPPRPHALGQGRALHQRRNTTPSWWKASTHAGTRDTPTPAPTRARGGPDGWGRAAGRLNGRRGATRCPGRRASATCCPRSAPARSRCRSRRCRARATGSRTARRWTRPGASRRPRRPPGSACSR